MGDEESGIYDGKEDWPQEGWTRNDETCVCEDVGSENGTGHSSDRRLMGLDKETDAGLRWRLSLGVSAAGPGQRNALRKCERKACTGREQLLLAVHQHYGVTDFDLRIVGVPRYRP